MLNGAFKLDIVFIMPCCAEECSGDIDCNGVVDGKDLAALATDYGKTGCTSQFTSAIRVYDDDDQYLGILLSNFGFLEFPEYDGPEIYIPSLKVSIKIEYNRGTPDGFPGVLENVYFGNPNCSGPAFFDGGNANVLYRAGLHSENPTRYFVRSVFVKKIVQIESILKTNPSSSQCDNSSITKGLYLASEILEADIPFNIPIALPLRFE